MLIIGLSGKAGSGKDTSANMLEAVFREQGLTTARISFAKGLKDVCSLLFGWDRARLDSDPYYKEGGLGGWVPRGKPGATPVHPSAMVAITDHTHVELDRDRACQLIGKTRRRIMQEVGTEAMRNGLHPEIWLIVTQLAIERGELNADVGFVTDCRFMNELAFIEKMNGITVMIDRPEVGTLTGSSQHASELEWLAWDKWDFHITNPGDSSLIYALKPVVDFILNSKVITNVG